MVGRECQGMTCRKEYEAIRFFATSLVVNSIQIQRMQLLKIYKSIGTFGYCFCRLTQIALRGTRYHRKTCLIFNQR
jgi:hypothetical protein